MANVSNADEYFKALGSLHDARMEAVRVSGNGDLIIAFDDIHSAFLGLPEYKGCLPAEVHFLHCSTGVTEFESANVYKLACDRSSHGGWIVKVQTWPSGNAEFSCDAIDVHDLSSVG